MSKSAYFVTFCTALFKDFAWVKIFEDHLNWGSFLRSEHLFHDHIFYHQGLGGTYQDQANFIDLQRTFYFREGTF